MRLLREFKIPGDAVGVPKKIEICFPFLFTSSSWTIPGYANLSSVAWSFLPVHDAADAWSQCSEDRKCPFVLRRTSLGWVAKINICLCLLAVDAKGRSLQRYQRSWHSRHQRVYTWSTWIRVNKAGVDHGPRFEWWSTPGVASGLGGQWRVGGWREEIEKEDRVVIRNVLLSFWHLQRFSGPKKEFSVDQTAGKDVPGVWLNWLHHQDGISAHA